MSNCPPPTPNLLIQENAADTLNACTNVLSFMLDALHEVEMEADPSVRDGAAWVHMLVIDALQYEVARKA